MEANHETNKEAGPKSEFKGEDMAAEEINPQSETVVEPEVESIPSADKRVEELEAESQDLKEKLLRTMADVENMRKRHQKEKSDQAVLPMHAMNYPISARHMLELARRHALCHAAELTRMPFVPHRSTSD